VDLAGDEGHHEELREGRVQGGDEMSCV